MHLMTPLVELLPPKIYHQLRNCRRLLLFSLVEIDYRPGG